MSPQCRPATPTTASMLEAVVLLKGVVEIALALLVTQGTVGLLVRMTGAGEPQGNPVYRTLGLATNPIRSLARRLTPRLVLDRHLGLVAGILLLWGWLILFVGKLQLTRMAG